jgi:hypothetical protein
VPGPELHVHKTSPDPRHLAGVRCLAIAAAAEAHVDALWEGPAPVPVLALKKLLLASGLLRAAGAWYLSR